MFIAFYIVFCVLEVVLFWSAIVRRYMSPYTLDVYFGKKGCGKSTTLQKLAFKYFKKGWHCFCDEGDSFQPFVTPIKADEMYKYKFPPRSIVFCGEANLYWDNRDFKTFPKPMQKFFRLQRHKKVKVVLFSQTYDTDKKIRDLADRLFIVRKRFVLWSCCSPYVKTPKIIPASETRDTAKMVDDFLKLPLLSFAKVITFIPAWVGHFDSFSDDGEDYSFDLSCDCEYCKPEAVEPPKE